MSSFPCLIRSVPGLGEVRYSLGHRLLDRDLEFVAGRARPNMLRAVAFDLKAFFTHRAAAADPVAPGQHQHHVRRPDPPRRHRGLQGLADPPGGDEGHPAGEHPPAAAADPARVLRADHRVRLARRPAPQPRPRRRRARASCNRFASSRDSSGSPSSRGRRRPSPSSWGGPALASTTTRDSSPSNLASSTCTWATTPWAACTISSPCADRLARSQAGDPGRSQDPPPGGMRADRPVRGGCWCS